jgi:L-Ala-D/L-Glu epimerase
LLKVKLGAAGDPERIAAVHAAAPRAELIVDANEGWRADNLAACVAAGVTLAEQPLPAGDDEALSSGRPARPIPVCADESVHDRTTLA